MDHDLPPLPPLPYPVAKNVLGPLFDGLKMHGYAASYATLACEPLLAEIARLKNGAAQAQDAAAREAKNNMVLSGAVDRFMDLTRTEREPDALRAALIGLLHEAVDEAVVLSGLQPAAGATLEAACPACELTLTWAPLPLPGVQPG